MDWSHLSSLVGLIIPMVRRWVVLPGSFSAGRMVVSNAATAYPAFHRRRCMPSWLVACGSRYRRPRWWWCGSLGICPLEPNVRCHGKNSTYFCGTVMSWMPTVMVVATLAATALLVVRWWIMVVGIAAAKLVQINFGRASEVGNDSRHVPLKLTKLIFGLLWKSHSEITSHGCS